MDKLKKKEKGKKGHDQEILPETTSKESVLPSPEFEDELRELQEEILLEAERDILDLEDDEEVLNGVMAQVLTKLSLEEPLYNEPKDIEEKVQEVLNEDVENCAILIDRLSAHIKKQTKHKDLLDRRRKTLSNIVQSIENLQVENSEEDLRNIAQKVSQKFYFLRDKLQDLIEEWGGDNSSEITEILSALTRANLDETGPTGEAKYVDVKNFRRDVVQFLVANRVVVWDKNENQIKLLM